MTIALDAAGEGEPLVLLHGVGTSREVWRHVLPGLAMTRRTIAVDLPGFGDSPPVGDRFDLDAVADAVADAAAARLDGPFDLLGHSLGGAVAVALARQRPESVRGLLLQAPAGLAPRPRVVATAAGITAEGFLATRRAIGGHLAGSAVARRVLLWGAVHDGGRLSSEDARLMLEASRSASRVRAAVESAVACDLRPMLAGVGAPLALLRGDRDKVVSAAAMRTLTETRPDALVATIHDCGHIPQLERPPAFLAAVERLLVGLGKS